MNDNIEYGTKEYYTEWIKDLEKQRDLYRKQSNYYQKELAKSHELLGRVIHQLSERWDNVNLTKYFPTDNLHHKRTLNNPEGETK